MRKNNDLKNWIILILVGVGAYWIINNLSIIGNILGTIFTCLTPFILGGVIAYILNIPMTKIESFLRKRIKKDSKFPVRIISIILSLLLLVVVLALVAFIILPELIENIGLLINSIPTIAEKVETWVLDMLNKYPEIQIKLQNIFENSTGFNDVVSSILNYVVNTAFGFISSLVSSFITFFTAIIFSIYMLNQKEELVKGSKKLVRAYLKKEHASKVIEITTLTNVVFNKFISGQCLEAVILGTIIFVVCSILALPYALLIAVLTAVTALIPMFGAFIALAIGTLLIATTSVIDAIVFILAFLIVQQIEGNFIYPKVVGKSVGLSPMWTLLAISVGGSLFGITGMLVGLPLASVVYTLIKDNVNKNLSKKK